MASTLSRRARWRTPLQSRRRSQRRSPVGSSASIGEAADEEEQLTPLRRPKRKVLHRLIRTRSRRRPRAAPPKSEFLNREEGNSRSSKGGLAALRERVVSLCLRQLPHQATATMLAGVAASGLSLPQVQQGLAIPASHDTHAHADPHPALWWWLLWSSPPPSRRAACTRPERGEHAHAAVSDDAPRHRARRIAHARSTRKDGNSGRVRDGGACGRWGAGTGRRARGSTREARAARGRGRSRQAQTRAAQHAHDRPRAKGAVD